MYQHENDKTNFAFRNKEGLVEPYFGLVNELKLIIKPSESKVVLYQINKPLTECKKIKDLKVKGFQLARSLSNEGYIIGCEKMILVYNSNDELEFNFATKCDFFGFDYHIISPFEIKIEKKRK